MTKEGVRMNGYSACLNGVNCKYNGKNNLREDIRQKYETEGGVLLCPEQAGGLGIPHPPSEIETGYDGSDVLAGRAKVLSCDGADVTAAFVEGARRTLEKVLNSGVKTVYLKQSSPSCGCGLIYDGTFSGKKISGDGVTAALLKQHGIEVIPVD